jgi:hypothetical protein
MLTAANAEAATTSADAKVPIRVLMLSLLWRDDTSIEQAQPVAVHASSISNCGQVLLLSPASLGPFGPSGFTPAADQGCPFHTFLLEHLV